MTLLAATGAQSEDLPSWIKNRPPGINFSDVVPSPDGKIIAFEYADNSLGRNYLGVGLFEWKIGKLTRIPNPDNRQLSSPSFSHDGKRLLVGVGAINGFYPFQISTVDLNTLKTTPLTPEGDGKLFPVFQPGTDNILYVRGTPGSLNGLNLFNPMTKTDRALVDDKNGFFFIMRPAFIGQNDIIFQARGPRNTMLREQAAELAHSASYAITYTLHIGGDVQVFSPEAERQSSENFLNDGAFSHVSASNAGKTLAYTAGKQASSPDKKNTILHELYASTNGKTSQLTNNGRNISLSHLSYDGLLIAFVSDITEPKNFDLFLYDMRTGETISTGLRERIATDPTFALRQGT